jgi:hypothetical protein
MGDIMSDRKSNNHRSDILYDLTIEKCGFDPREIGWQKKKIWAVCRYCGESHEIYGANYRKNKTDFHTEGSACHNECRLKEMAEAGSPFADTETKQKAQENRTKNISQEEINKKISIGRRKAQKQLEATCIEKYGVANPFQNEEIKQKIKETLISKYGVDSPQKSNLIRQKTEETIQTSYGVSNPMQNLEVAAKSQKTWLQKVKDDPTKYYIRALLRGEQFWDCVSAGNNLTSICKKLDVDYGSVASVLSCTEFRDKWMSSYSYPKRQKQNQIANAIRQFGLSVETDVKNIITPNELDIVIKDKKFAIEFNGSAWHSELFAKDPRNQHLFKTNLCQQKGYQLFHLFEKTWDERSSQVLNYIKTKLGVNKRIWARDCSVNNDHCPFFIDENHIQGEGTGTLKYFNLLYDDKIVGSMTATRHHYNTDSRKDSIILSRLCFSDGISVVGGASKLFKYFKQWAIDNGYANIISWSDNIYTQGDIYRQLSFVEADTLPQDYFYWDSSKNEYLSKRSQSKTNSNCPLHLTEHEWALERGLYRIWDCGKKRWEMMV